MASDTTAVPPVHCILSTGGCEPTSSSLAHRRRLGQGSDGARGGSDGDRVIISAQ